MDSEVKGGLKSNSVRSGQPTDDNLDSWIYIAPIKFILVLTGPVKSNPTNQSDKLVYLCSLLMAVSAHLLLTFWVL